MKSNADTPLSIKTRIWVSVLGGLGLALLAGGGIVFHDGKSIAEGLLAGLGFFAFGFVLLYFRYARRLAEVLSVLR